MFLLKISVMLLLNGQEVFESHAVPYNSLETCEAVRAIAAENLEIEIQKDLLGYSAKCEKA